MRVLDEANAERHWCRTGGRDGRPRRDRGDERSGGAEGRTQRAGTREDQGGVTGPRPAHEGAVPRDQDVAAQAVLLSAAFDRAALAIDEGGDSGRYRAAMLALLEAVVGKATDAM